MREYPEVLASNIYASHDISLGVDFNGSGLITVVHLFIILCNRGSQRAISY